MSGHSRWTQIKRQKAVTDQKRGGLFTKLGNAITVAAKQGGEDPTMNFKLRITIDKAKQSNMPNENIERAIKRGTGTGEGTTLEEVVYEGFGPAGTAIVIEATTDNKNRTSSNIRSILSKYQGNLGSTGSVLWMFAKKGVIRVEKSAVPNSEQLELQAIDAGADDILEEREGVTIYTTPEMLPTVRKTLEAKGITIAMAETELIPTTKVAITETGTKEKLQKLIEELEECEDVTNYFTNAEH